ncbi:MAG: hypothetical protein D6758_03495 [Gammaproteobacteria bacterium]|nr:MAG: hypothetical protein D6758_03495 [Gammaproteobacteria bacterium]
MKSEGENGSSANNVKQQAFAPENSGKEDVMNVRRWRLCRWLRMQPLHVDDPMQLLSMDCDNGVDAA